MFFYNKEKIDEVEKLILDIEKYYELARKKYNYLKLPPYNLALFNMHVLYHIISNYYPYSCIVNNDGKYYLCVNDSFYDLDGKINDIKLSNKKVEHKNNNYLPDIIYNYIDDNISKNNIKHL